MKRKMLPPISLLVFLILTNGLWAQSQFSAAAKRLNKRVETRLHRSSKNTLSLRNQHQVLKGFACSASNQGLYIDGLIKVNQDFDATQLQEHGIITRPAAGNIVPLKIPVAKLGVLADIKGIEYLEVDTPIKTKLDVALVQAGVQPAYQGIDLNQAYTGKGVVVGILDGGFDYTHPMFYDAEGDLRVVRGWDQIDDYGPAPEGYDYGTELVAFEDFNAVEVSMDAEENSHGSHVAGIAGGSQVDPNNSRGMAPESELIFITLGGGNSVIVDGAQYIFDYAEDHNMPAVINMSLGSHIGPHDGNSLLDQAFDSMTGPGKIFIGASGNEGDMPLHLKSDFSESNDPVKTLMMFEQDDNYGSGTLEIWGSPNSSLQISISVLDPNFEVVDYSALHDSSELDGVYVFDVASDDSNGVACEIAVTPCSPLNNKPNIQIYAENDEEDYTVLIKAYSPDGVVEMWNHGTGYGAPLASNEIEGLTAGDINSTMGEIGGTAKSVITVGAYTTKNTYMDYLGQEQEINSWAEIGEIAPFSSRGPTADGRMKPDITAPGNVVVSAGSSYDYTLRDKKIVTLIDDQWPMIALAGTSMATPCVVGIVALLLEADPTLTHDDIIDLFWYTAIIDDFTGDLPEGDNTWGLGKIDAQGALQALEGGLLDPDPNAVEILD